MYKKYVYSVGTVLLLLILLTTAVQASLIPGNATKIEIEDLGPVGYGSKFFRCAVEHSSGIVYIGTYGPQPAIVWKYDPKKGTIKKIAEPGEYQLDCMIEAPNGMIYIGTAYNALVYRLDPRTDEIVSLGSPPIESTPWIFNMVVTQDNEIYGAKGVGIFRLDWKTDKFEAIGLVEGNHKTFGPNPSNPITRVLVQSPDGTIWGDTNRWLFKFDPKNRKIENLIDMVTVDPSCFALFLAKGKWPTNDCYFALYSRFSGEKVKSSLYVYRAREKCLEVLKIPGLVGRVIRHPIWWCSGKKPILLVPMWDEQEQKRFVSVVDPFGCKLLGKWFHEDDDQGTAFDSSNGEYLYAYTDNYLMRYEPDKHRAVKVVYNPTPAQCRSLAISPQKVLGTDTYDYGHAMTYNLKSSQRNDHGKVWNDDHRCNYGPAAFAGKGGQYLLANHGQADSVAALWVTDTENSRHWRLGVPAFQLISFSDGTVWGTTGRNLNTLEFDNERSWVQGCAAMPGKLFYFKPHDKQITMINAFDQVGPITEAPGGKSQPLVTNGRSAAVYDPVHKKTIMEFELPAEAMAAAYDSNRSVSYLALNDGSLLMFSKTDSGLFKKVKLTDNFGSTIRGFFVLAQSGRVVGVSQTGALSVYDPNGENFAMIDVSAPLPAGPAVDPEEDAWYFADYTVKKYKLKSGEPNNYSSDQFEKPGVKDYLPVFYEKLGQRMSYPLSWLSGYHEDFEAWRKLARKQVKDSMLSQPPEVPFDPVVIAQEDRGSYVAQKLLFNVTGDSRVLAYMLVPKGQGPFPAIILLHDHGARFDIGKEKVIRPFNDPAKLESAQQWVNECYSGRFIGDELAKRGYFCFATDAINWSDRGGAGYEGQQALTSNLMHLGMSLAGLIAYEDIRVAKFLSTLGDVDKKCIVSMGWSMGSFRSWQLAALSEHVTGGIAICWMGTTKGLMVPGNNQTGGQSAFTLLHPGLSRYLDYPDVASIACPKPMLFYNGTQDLLFPVNSVNEAYAKMHKVWKSQNADDRLETRLWDVPHVFNKQMQETAFNWLGVNFGNIKK